MTAVTYVNELVSGMADLHDNEQFLKLPCGSRSTVLSHRHLDNHRNDVSRLGEDFLKNKK
jgi:hypothetical protein